jgi:hypothetical protein
MGRTHGTTAHRRICGEFLRRRSRPYPGLLPRVPGSSSFRARRIASPEPPAALLAAVPRRKMSLPTFPLNRLFPCPCCGNGRAPGGGLQAKIGASPVSPRFPTGDGGLGFAAFMPLMVEKDQFSIAACRPPVFSVFRGSRLSRLKALDSCRRRNGRGRVAIGYFL